MEVVEVLTVLNNRVLYEVAVCEAKTLGRSHTHTRTHTQARTHLPNHTL